MIITKNQISQTQVELTIELTVDEIKPFLAKAADKISQTTKIAGFRPGKAPYDVIKNQVGEMTIYQEATEAIVAATLFEALEKELPDAEIVGQPQINIEKMAPDNPLSYKALVTLVPEIKLGDYQNLKITKKEIKIDEEKIKKTLASLTKMMAKEEIKTGPLAKGDKAVVSFQVFVDRVLIEGGAHQSYPIVIGEDTFIPGFEDQLVGLSKGDKKEFELNFPEKYHQKNLAGKLALFKVEIVETYSYQPAELTDDFAKTLNYQNLDELKQNVRTSIEQEAKVKENQRQELELLEQLIAVSTFGELPQTLLDKEAHKMVHELEHGIAQQGLKFEDYLAHLKKTEADLEKEFLPEAAKRIKTSLILRQIAKEQKIVVSKEDLDQEITKISQNYQDNPEALEQIKTAGYRHYLSNAMTNQRVMDFLKK
ncbi:MAG: trigger factor [Patescibacteria group bacterium]